MRKWGSTPGLAGRRRPVGAQRTGPAVQRVSGRSAGETVGMPAAACKTAATTGRDLAVRLDTLRVRSTGDVLHPPGRVECRGSPEVEQERRETRGPRGTLCVL